MTLGDYIKKYRQSHGLSMDDFAKMTGLSKAYVSILERNNNPSTGKAAVPSLETIKRVATATTVDFNDLISMLDNDQEVFVGQKDSVEEQEAQPIVISGRSGLGKSNLFNKSWAPEHHVFISYSHKKDDLSAYLAQHLQQQLESMDNPKCNLVYTCSKEGMTQMRRLSDEQFSALIAILEQMPETVEVNSD